MFFWKRVHTERVNKNVVLVVDLDIKTQQYTGSIQGKSWSSGSGNWYWTQDQALRDARERWAKRLEQMDKHEKSTKK